MLFRKRKMKAAGIDLHQDYRTYWKLHELFQHTASVQTEINGVWVPARPINYKFFTPWDRIKLAWRVFTGKLDVFEWPKGQ